MKRSTAVTSGLLLLFAALSLTSCRSVETRPTTLTIEKVKTVPVPDALTEPVEVAWPTPRCFDGPAIVYCNEQLARLITLLVKALEQSNADKQSIRALGRTDALPTDNPP